MKTLEITLKNGKFISSNIEVEEFSDKYVRWNGWECFIRVNGAIKCCAVHEEDQCKKEIYVIIYPNGSREVKYRENDGSPKLLKKGYIVPKGESIGNGRLGLSDGPIEKRYVYFRHELLQKFLSEYGINKIKKADPNNVYHGYVAFNDDDSENYYSTIKTDGEEEVISEEISENEELPEVFSENNDLTIRSEKIKVSNASWALKIVRKRMGEEVYIYRVLYTLENFKELNIPEQYKVK